MVAFEEKDFTPLASRNGCRVDEGNEAKQPRDNPDAYQLPKPQQHEFPMSWLLRFLLCSLSTAETSHQTDLDWERVGVSIGNKMPTASTPQTQEALEKACKPLRVLDTHPG